MSIRTTAIAGATDRAPLPGADWPALLPDVARLLLGEPPRIEAGGATWRYGRRGSLAVHVGGHARGTWHSFEADTSGGTLALVEHVNGCDRAAALVWLADCGLIAAAGTRRLSEKRAVTASRRQSGIQACPESGAAALATGARRPVDSPPPAPTAELAASILARSVPADATPARAYLAARGTWPPFGTGPDLPEAVRWLPPDAWAHLPPWTSADGRERRLHPPADGPARLSGPQPPPCGALVWTLGEHGRPPDGAAVEPVTAAGHRLPWPGDRKGRKLGAARGRAIEIPPHGGATVAVAVVEGPADALQLARLRLPGLMIRAACTVVTAPVLDNVPLDVPAVLVSDGDQPGWTAVAKAHRALAEAGRTCYAAMLRGGDADELLRGADTADLAERVAERAAILELDGGLPRGAATARALAMMLKSLSPPEGP